MSEHTPTPWHVDSIDPAFVSVRVNDGHEEDVILECYSVDDGAGEITQMMARNNAAFIVRACNAHEALVEALEAANALFHISPDLYDESDWAVGGQIDAALALARGEKGTL